MELAVIGVAEGKGFRHGRVEVQRDTIECKDGECAAIASGQALGGSCRSRVGTIKAVFGGKGTERAQQ